MNVQASFTKVEDGVAVATTEFQRRFARSFDEVGVGLRVERLRPREAIHLGDETGVEVSWGNRVTVHIGSLAFVIAADAKFRRLLAGPV